MTTPTTTVYCVTANYRVALPLAALLLLVHDDEDGDGIGGVGHHRGAPIIHQVDIITERIDTGYQRGIVTVALYTFAGTGKKAIITSG